MRNLVFATLVFLMMTTALSHAGQDMSEKKTISSPGNVPEHMWFQNFEKETGFTAGDGARVSSDVNTSTETVTRCIRLDVREPGEPGNDLNRITIVANDGNPVDIRGYRFLNFYLKDTQGESARTVTLVDSSGNEWLGWADIWSESDDWKKVVVPLDRLDSIDLSTVKEVRIGEWHKGTYYIDDIYFALNETSLPETDETQNTADSGGLIDS